jgi:micrococcal nuclease
VGAERLILLFFLMALLSGCREEEVAPETGPSAVEHAVVDHVDDGDTLTLRNGRKVRLLQIDAPELHGDCYGRTAARALAALVPTGAPVTLVRDVALDATDRYGRLLRYVFVDGRNVNVALVRRGAASPYFFRNDRGRYARALVEAVEDARDADHGYWGACPGAELNPGLGAVTGPA